MPSGVLDLVDSDRVDLAESAMRQAKGDDMLDGVENFFPNEVWNASGRSPTQAVPPSGRQKQHIRYLVKVRLPSPQGTSLDDDSPTKLAAIGTRPQNGG